MKVVTVEQMQAIERATDRAGIPFSQMMENAGRGVGQAVSARLDVRDRLVVILAGPGSNGGDGLVAGRYLAEAGARVSVFLHKARGDDDTNYTRLRELEVPIVVAYRDLDRLVSQVAGADVLIDALLGTGADRPIEGDLKVFFSHVAQGLQLNRRRRPDPGSAPMSPLLCSHDTERAALVVAVDCPSGLNCQTGQLDPAAVAADLTVTFDSPKIGHFLFPGAEAVGELVVADIGVPAGLPECAAVELDLVTADDVRAWLPPRPLSGHKGSFGKVMVVAGSLNYTGAAALAAQGAYRAGAGLVTLAAPGTLHTSLAAQVSEATFVLLPHHSGAIGVDAVPVLAGVLSDYDALLVGPGLGRDDKTRSFLQDLLRQKAAAPKGPIGFAPAARPGGQVFKLPPLVVDADGLNLLAEIEAWPQLLPPGTVLTPHPGEMARLFGCELAQVQADRVGTARQAASEWGQVVVLKGAFTVIASPDGQASLLPFASSALATAGSGDVLAGAIVALLGMGLAPYRAAQVAGFLHGMAGVQLADELGAAGVMAGDLPLALAQAQADLLR